MESQETKLKISTLLSSYISLTLIVKHVLREGSNLGTHEFNVSQVEVMFIDYDRRVWTERVSIWCRNYPC